MSEKGASAERHIDRHSGVVSEAFTSRGLPGRPSPHDGGRLYERPVEGDMIHRGVERLSLLHWLDPPFCHAVQIRARERVPQILPDCAAQR